MKKTTTKPKNDKSIFRERVLQIVASIPKGRVTTYGAVAATATIMGFRKYLEMTDAEKLRLVNAPKLQPEAFAKYLPYAMALHVEGEWAKQFSGVFTGTPRWYEGPPATDRSESVLKSISALRELHKKSSPK